ncbi:MAG: A/G-specific adenine glycosylase [Clostridia bacterium]|nr:A/G-specific adenine glycosylase [Clostridia bacterium]
MFVIDSTENQTLLRDAIPHLISWYKENKKEYPWRVDATPYHVWVSEIMLQQTRIEAALDYYKRFTAELPTVKALAEVDDERLMKLWQGLGYYSRARNLKKAAVRIMEEHGGELPCSAEALRKLPGIGDYTAGAIASIAYHKSEPAVDGNVLRVISRIIASYEDIMLPATKKSVTALLRKVYPSGTDAALLTEGLMELGEQVCIPNGEPRCESCPIASLCRAFAENKTSDIPVREVKKEKRREEKTVLLLRSREGRYAIQKRSEKGLLANMWEFPTLDGKCAEGDVESYLAEQGFSVEAVLSCGEAEHIFTHIVWQMIGFSATVFKETGDYIWKSREEIMADYAIPSAYRYYVKQLK